MSVSTVAFFNNKGGVGKTSLVYHLAWMLADMGKRIVAVDLDPQANLSSAFLDEDELEPYWQEGGGTIYGAVRPVARGISDFQAPRLSIPDANLGLVIGDLAFSNFEDALSYAWPDCLAKGDSRDRAFRVISAPWRAIQKSALEHEADLILLDLGPNLGAINRAALISSDYVVIPLAPDLYSLQGLRNLGPRLREWREEWKERVERNTESEFELPLGQIHPIGYLVTQHTERSYRPAMHYRKWISRIPSIYREEVLDRPEESCPSVENDSHCLALLKHYRSLMAMSQESRKPIFHLKSADGAIGAHQAAVKSAYHDYKQLATEILARIQAHKDASSEVQT